MTGPGGDGRRPAGDRGGPIGFKSHLRATVVPGEAAYLVSQRGVTALRGTPAEVLVPLLDGTRDHAEVISAATPLLTTEEAAGSLRALDAAGLLRLGTPGTADPAAEAYWDLAGPGAPAALAALAGAAVALVPLAGTDAAEAAEACRASGLTVTDAPERADLTLVLCDDYLDPELAEVDARQRTAGTPWLPVRTGAAALWLGPVLRPHDGPCWHCLATRLRGHRYAERPLQRALGEEGPVRRPHTTLAAGRAVAVHLAVLEAAKWLAGARGASHDGVTTLDTLTLDTATHPAARLPQCAVCGDPGLTARRIEAPFVPVSRPKAAGELNGHRALTPAQMLERYGHLVGPVTGIVKEIRRAPGSPGFVSTYLSGQNLAMRSGTLAGLRAGLRSLSGGKGLTDTEARTSALCEAVERYSGTRQGDEPVVRDTYRALGEDAVHPNAVQLFHDRQFADRDRWNGGGSHLHHVPRRFDEERPTEWTPVWSLTHERQRLLPTSLLFFGEHEAPDGVWADSNGNAAGSSPEDALVQGFLELVERDAVAIWWYNRTRHPAVDLDAFGEPYIERLRAGYRSVGREVWALDLTGDLGIPVVAALSRRTDRQAEDIVFGFGAHFDPRVALRRALTEMGQLLPLVGDVTPDGRGYRCADPDPLNWWRHATAANRPYLRPDPATPARTPGHWAYTPAGDLLDDVRSITELLRSRGLELLVLDQTRPDLDLPVVKVLVPGLRHFWPRFAPGRLYDTPVELGLRTERCRLEELNPTPLFV